jgi:hypothetical protein
VTIRRALRAVRRAGPRAFALSLLAHLPALGLAFFAAGLLAVLSLVLANIVTFGLVRLLAAYRDHSLPTPPESPSVVAVPSDADRSPAYAVRQALRLWRPAVTLTGIQILCFATALLMVVGIGSIDLTVETTEEAVHAARIAALGAWPIVSLMLAFVQVAPQRIALEGDPRTLVACAHSVRIARKAYGALLLLAGAEIGLAVAGLVLASPVAGIALFATAVVVRPFVVAIGTELYVAGERLDVPADFGQRRRGGQSPPD